MDSARSQILHENCRISRIIVCHLHNRLNKKFNLDRLVDETIVNTMLEKVNVPNEFAEEVEEASWVRRTQPFQKLSFTDIVDFPEFDETQLKILFTGTYQLKQSVSYLGEILEEDNSQNVYF